MISLVPFFIRAPCSLRHARMNRLKFVDQQWTERSNGKGALPLRLALTAPYLINAAAFAGHNVFQALYTNFVAQDRLEEDELVLAEPFATGRRGANRAVVLDEQETVVVARANLSHVSLLGADSGQLLKLLVQRHSRGNQR